MVDNFVGFFEADILGAATTVDHSICMGLTPVWTGYELCASPYTLAHSSLRCGYPSLHGLIPRVIPHPSQSAGIYYRLHCRCPAESVNYPQ